MVEPDTENKDSANPSRPSSVPITERAPQAPEGSLHKGPAPRKNQEVMAVPSDEELFKRGDRESLSILVTRYQQTLYGLLVHVTSGDGSLAEDLFQEAFVRAVRGAKTFDASRSFKSWITAIALNLVRDEVRKRKLRGEVPLGEGGSDEHAAEGILPTEAAEHWDEVFRVRKALEDLTEKEREVVLLHFYQGHTLGEVSEILSVPLGTVKSRLHGALVRLKGLLRSERP